MDTQLVETLQRFHIDPSSVPRGEVGWFDSPKIWACGPEAQRWLKSNPSNAPALAYSVDSEHESAVGVILRNLQTGARRSHRMITKGTGPFWHNLHVALPQIYQQGLAVLVEGPKDARFLWSATIPAVAYLGSSPGSDHFKMIARYADVIVWIPDNDPTSREKENRERKVYKMTGELGVRMIQIPIAAKDPAEMDATELNYLKGRIQEIASFL